MNQRFQPLTTEQSKILISIIMSRNERPDVSDKDYPFLSQIVKQRIEAMKLPIRFTPAALVAVNAFCDRPGSAVILLIDALNRFCPREDYERWLNKEKIENPREVTTHDLCELYPVGFYTEDALTDLIDNTMKAHRPDTAEDMKAVREGTFNKKPKVPWAELY